MKNIIECPHCGNTTKNVDRIINRNTILRCTKCGCHYLFFGETWNFSRRQREIREEKSRKEALMKEQVQNKAEEYRIRAEKRINEIRRDANIEIESIRLNEQDKYRKNVSQRIPSYLRWLLKKYL